MFGYIIVNRQELKLRELDVYQSWYCGLCRQLKEKYGVKGQLTLTYDMTFLILLLSGCMRRRKRPLSSGARLIRWESMRQEAVFLPDTRRI